MTPRVQALQQARHQHAGIGRLLVGVGDAQAATYVDMLDRDTCGFHRFDEVEHPVECIQVRLELRDLRADVAVDAHHPQARQRRRVAVGGQRFVVGDAELVALQSGGDVRVGAGVDIGVDAQAHGRDAAQGPGFFVECVELAQAFDVETAHAGHQGLAHVGAGFAHARKHDLRRVAAGCQHAGQFTAGHDVEAAAGLGKSLQHGQRGVGLHGITHQVPAALQRVGVSRQGRQHRGARVHEQWRAEAPCQICQRMTLKAQFTPFTSQERRAGQTHRAGAEAALLAAGAAGKVSGPFWPQPEINSTSPANSAVSAAVCKAAAGRIDTLFTGRTCMQRIL